jgi:hypothetical protein
MKEKKEREKRVTLFKMNSEHSQKKTPALCVFDETTLFLSSFSVSLRCSYLKLSPSVLLIKWSISEKNLRQLVGERQKMIETLIF